VAAVVAAAVVAVVAAAVTAVATVASSSRLVPRRSTAAIYLASGTTSIPSVATTTAGTPAMPWRRWRVVMERPIIRAVPCV